MPEPKVIQLNYSYKKEESAVWVINDQDIPVDKNLIKDIQHVHLAPGSTGGNHKHPRIEWFVGFGDLEFVWLDEDNQVQVQHMNPNGQLLLIEVPPYLPHAVRNISSDQFGILYEMADGIMENVEKVEVVK